MKNYCVMMTMLAGLSSAQASVMAWRSNVQADGDAMHLWSFEGSTGAERQSDGVGTNDLAEVGSGTHSSRYGAGYDGTSQAFTTERGTNTAYETSLAVSMPTTASFEAIVSADALASGTGYLFAAFHNPNDPGDPGLRERGYFGAQTTTNLIAISGHPYSNSISYGTYSAGSWYYMASTFSYNAVSEETTVTTWLADLSAGNPTLVSGGSNSFAGNFALNYQYGVGILRTSTGGRQEAFVGDIDEIALYSGLKDESFFQGQLATIVPEPSSLVLLAMGGLALGRRRR